MDTFIRRTFAILALAWFHVGGNGLITFDGIDTAAYSTAVAAGTGDGMHASGSGVEALMPADFGLRSPAESRLRLTVRLQQLKFKRIESWNLYPLNGIRITAQEVQRSERVYRSSRATEVNGRKHYLAFRSLRL